MEKSIVTVNSKEEFLKIKDNYGSHQYFSYPCEKCGQRWQKPKWKLKKDNWKLLCRDCSFKSKFRKTWNSKPKEELEEIERKKKQTSLKNWGVENPMQNKEVVELLKESNLQKYGVDSFSKTENFKKGIKEIWQNKSKEEIKDMVKKVQETTMEKYGVENAMQTSQFKEKLKESNLQKYGVECTFQLDSVKEKTKQTWREKYGVENPTQNKDIQEKSKQTNLKKYGVEHYAQSKDMQLKRKSHYTFDDIGFDSKPEISFYIWAKDHNLNIKRVPKAFKYIWHNKKCRYYPDFEIEGKYYEIKGNQFLTEDGKWQNPFKHSEDDKAELKHQCALQNDVIILYEKDYQKYIEYCESKHGKNYLNQFKTEK